MISTPPTGSGRFVRATITLVMAATAALAFAFSFGNVWALALRLGISRPVAPLIAPMVDLSVVGLLVVLHHLVAADTDPAQLRPATRLMHLCGLLTLALNTAEPVLAGHYGRAILDAVAPALLLGWGSVGLPLLRLLHSPTPSGTGHSRDEHPEAEHASRPAATAPATPQPSPKHAASAGAEQAQSASDPAEGGPLAKRDPVLGTKRTGRKPAASLDELSEIARPAVEEHGPTHAVIRNALREADMPASNERIGVLVQRFKDEQADAQASLSAA
ncbi:SpdA protein [Kitasatospora sp. NPDC096128]|uniref:SpdA protein n=1 Tax=Kitasatospora sp. NPDC096128 TaxID=3155547 RepID=UPI00331AF6F8